MLRCVKTYFFNFYPSVGSLAVKQVLTGKVARVNIWDRVLSEEELKGLGCRDQGNVVNWDTLEVMGTANVQYEYFPCKGRKRICSYIHMAECIQITSNFHSKGNK